MCSSDLNITDFGPTKPTIQPYQNGYSVPVALEQIERPGIEEDTIEYSWQGYLLFLPFLSDLEFDRAITELPDGDYSAERLAVLQARTLMDRRAAYPSIEEYVYAVAQDDADAIAAFRAKVAAVNEQYLMPSQPLEGGN